MTRRISVQKVPEFGFFEVRVVEVQCFDVCIF